MTEEEYEKLGKKQLSDETLNHDETINSNSNSNPNDNNPSQTSGSIGSQTNTVKKAAVIEEERRSEPINLSMLQGAFYILLLGHMLSTCTFFMELGMFTKKHRKIITKKKRQNWFQLTINKYFKCYFCKLCQKPCFNFVRWIKEKFEQAIHEVALDSLEYVE